MQKQLITLAISLAIVGSLYAQQPATYNPLASKQYERVLAPKKAVQDSSLVTLSNPPEDVVGQPRMLTIWAGPCNQ